jgi:hypothetical protein
MDFSYSGSYKRRWVVSKIRYLNRKSETCGLSEFVRFLDLPQMWQFTDLGFEDPIFLYDLQTQLNQMCMGRARK